jgi:MFS family permease
MEPTTIMLLVGAAFAVVFGPLTARSTERREKIYGGTVARVLNLIASVLFVAIVPTVLTGVILGHGFLGLPYALAYFLASFIVLLIYAMIERPAREANVTERSIVQGWTEQDARSSGL